MLGFCQLRSLAQNLLQNGGFETVLNICSSDDSPFRQPTQIPGWEQSHGSPQVFTNGTGNCNPTSADAHSGQVFAYMAVSGFGGGYSEGIFTNINMNAGKAYRVKFWVRTYYPGVSGSLDATYYISATNGLQPRTYYDGQSLPIPTQQQFIYSGTELNTNTWQQKSVIFYPDQNYTQLWVYVPLNGGREFLIDDIEITEETTINQLSGSNGFICGPTQFTTPITSSTYNWYVSTNNASVSGSGNTVTVTPNGSGNVTICVQPSNGVSYCRTFWSGPPALNNVYIDGNLNPGPYAVYSNTTHYISSSSPNATSYFINSTTNSGNIFLNLTGINNGNCQVNVAGSTGNGSVNITVSNSCGSYVRYNTFYIPASYRLYANPAKEDLSVQFSYTDYRDALPDLLEILSEKQIKVVKSIDIGKIFSSKSFIDGNKIVIDVRDLANGTYYLRVKNPRLQKDKQVETTRFVIEK